MITTNLPQLVQELNVFGTVRVHDHMDTIDLELFFSSFLEKVDDLICDALFADPLDREVTGDHCTVYLGKRDSLRGASDMGLIAEVGHMGYVLQPVR